MRRPKISLFVFILLISLLYSCSGDSTDRKHFNVKNFQSIVLSAINGIKSANDSLSGLIDFSLPVNNRYNILKIDSISLPVGRRFYTVLLEYPNPMYNRFAVYDSSLQLLLLDKSLNGYLSQGKMGTDRIRFLTLEESFRVKDFIKLKRLSFYYVKSDSIHLALRTFLEYDDSSNVIRQNVQSITGNFLFTSIESNPKNLLPNTQERYLIDTISGKIISQDTIVDKTIRNLIFNFNRNYSLNQIFDKKSALRSIGITAAIDSVHNYNNVKEKKSGFSLSLPPEGWRIKKDIFFSDQLKKAMKGNLYINESQGASFSVIEIGADQVAENFIPYTLDQEAKKFYTVRFTLALTIAKKIYRFFEISCLDKKYMIIFQSPRSSYEKYKEEYENIINSFGVDC